MSNIPKLSMLNDFRVRTFGFRYFDHFILGRGGGAVHIFEEKKRKLFDSAK